MPVSNATEYEVEYTTKKIYFDSNDSAVSKKTVDATKVSYAIASGLTSGEEYFFRVRAKNDHGVSGWTPIRSIIIGEPPSAPTTWSSTTTAVIGNGADEEVTLFWFHNSKDKSNQTAAMITIRINSVHQTYTITGPTNDDDENLTNSCVINVGNSTISWVENGSTITRSLPATITDGTRIQWEVCTRGILNEFGPTSTPRHIDVYAAPWFEELTILDGNKEDLEVLTSFPIYIHASTGPSTQTPVGYHVSIVSNEVYETADDVGNVKMVNKGEEVYSRFFDNTPGSVEFSDVLDVILDAGNVDLNNGISYTIYCTAAMDSGLSAEASISFTVSWIDPEYLPNAEIAFDKESIVTNIRPYCENRKVTYYKVNYANYRYVKSTTSYSSIYHDRAIANAVTTTGEPVSRGVTPYGDEVYYCRVEEETPITDVWLSVYRREFDGSFTEIVKDMDGEHCSYVTDPHPALDYARYRIVAKDKGTGGVSFYDVPGYPINEKAIIIQWDEAWTNFETSSDDPLDQPPWSGSLLKLPYNIDVSDKNSIDVALIEYIGRKRPVSYYGTQLGETSTWSTEIPKHDEETLYALRRLAIWTGDVYVREPSGSGYWANIAVTFSQKHLETTIPVTLELTRVEGGM
jgi:hypothetical protein